MPQAYCLAPPDEPVASAGQVSVRVIERDRSPACSASAAAHIDALTIAFFQVQIDVYLPSRLIGNHNDVGLLNGFEQPGAVDLFKAELPERLIEDVAFRDRNHSQDDK